MAPITLDNHDLLGKLSIIKNALSMALEQPQNNQYLKMALEANQDLINKVKGATANGQNLNH